MFETLTSYIGAAAMLTVGILAFSLGGQTEKIAAGSYILAWIATMIVQSLLPLTGVQWGTMIIDMGALAVFIAIVWKAKKSWPVWVCALQLLAVCSHIMLIARLPTPVYSFYTVLNLTAYGILIAISVGTFWTWQERRFAGINKQDSRPFI